MASTDSRQPELAPWMMLTGVLVVVGLVYLPVITFGFAYDDSWTIVQNGFLRRPQDLWVLFTPDAARVHVPDSFRPVLVAFDVLTYQLVGLDAATHHAISILLHVGVCAALARWLVGLAAPVLLRVSTVALFGALAIHAEAVTVVSFREDLLAALAGVLAMVATSASLSATGPRRWALLAAGTAAAAVASGAKMSAAPIFVFWWLAEWLSPWRMAHPARRRAEGAVALGLGAVVAILVTAYVQGAWTPYGASDNLRLEASRVGIAAVLAESTQIHLGYLQQMLVPLGLSPEYVDRGASWTAPATVLASAALAALLLYAVAYRRSRPVVALAVLGAFALAVPTSNLFAMPNMRADRFMYLPSLPICIGLAVACVVAGRALARRLARPSAVVAPVFAMFVVQGGAAQATSKSYRSDQHLWDRALRTAPASARANAMAGLMLLGAIRREPGGRIDQVALGRVRAHCANAERLDPDYELPQVCFARLAVLERAWPEAHARFARALDAAHSRRDRILAALAQISLDLPVFGHSEAARRALALRYLDRAIREYPYSAAVEAVAGQIHHRLGDPASARLHYDRARSLQPERWEVVLWGLELDLDLGHAAAARRAWLRLQKDPILENVDAVSRSAMAARIRDAQRLFPNPAILPPDPWSS